MIMHFRFGCRFLLWLAVACCCVAALGGFSGRPDAWAQSAAQSQPARDWTASLAAVARQLRDPRMDDAGFAELRTTLDRLRIDATQERDQARQAAGAAQLQLDALGQPPAAGQPRESAAVAESRRQLTARVQASQDAVKQADLVLARIVSLQEEVAGEARRQFTRQLAYRGQSPFSPDFWREGAADIGAAIDQEYADPKRWWRLENTRGSAVTTLLQMALVAAVAVVLLIPVQRSLGRSFGITPAPAPPSPARRNAAALVVLIRRTALPLVVMWTAYGVLAGSGWLGGTGGELLLSLLQAISFSLMTYGLAIAGLAPHHEEWGLVRLPLPDRATLRGRTLIFAFGVVALAVPVALSRSPDFGSSGRDMVLAAVALFLAVSNIAFADPRLWRNAPDGMQFLRIAGGAVIAFNLVALTALLLGYYGFAAYISYGLLGSALALAAYALVRTAMRDGLAHLAEQTDSRPGHWRHALGLTGPMNTTTQLLLGLFADVILFVLLLVALALVWGVGWATLTGYMLELFYGVSIGPVRISLGSILAAVAVVTVGIGLTRLLSGGLNTRLQRQSGIDPGVRNSMVTGLSYVGYILAVVAGIGAMGLDLSNLAIIAGALSVGIGFGLQNIVNNFVSGLILLIERPVKVGDWVVVGDREGYVRRINVRSTEIETFPRASVIIPNSELISSPVMNWTHRNRLGRVDINIGLSYGTDAEQARDLLLRCLSDHPEILADPPPAVIFRDFGDSALIFAVRGFIADVERRLGVESELRFAIYKACRAGGIEIPYAQTDVHLADIERIEKALLALGGARAAETRETG